VPSDNTIKRSLVRTDYNAIAYRPTGAKVAYAHAIIPLGFSTADALDWSVDPVPIIYARPIYPHHLQGVFTIGPLGPCSPAPFEPSTTGRKGGQGPSTENVAN